MFNFNMKIIIIILHFLSLLIFFNLFISSYYSVVEAADPYYESCIVPKTCGNQTITFPFFIQNQQVQQPYCGYPGFNLTCDSRGRSIINLSSQNYVSCLPSLRSLTDFSHGFKIADANGDQNSVVLLYNCQSSSTTMKNRIGYYEENRTNSVLAFYESEEDELAKALRMCVAGPTGYVVAVKTVAGLVVKNNELGRVLRMRDVVRNGFLVSWLASNCSLCYNSGGRCGFFWDIYHFKCFCPERKEMHGLGLGIGLALGGIVIIVSVLLLTHTLWKRHQTNENVQAFLNNYGPIQVRRYSYSKIKKMTNSFTQKLGQGGFGDVYKGILDDGSFVAVKVLNQSKSRDGQDFMNEVATISRTSHVNIVTLLGFCFEGSKRALIYEFMPNGSLEKFIFDDNTTDENSHQLDWETYYQISLGIARGLEYLHRGCNTRILHFDIKPHNILLDVGFVPKISDFGLAKICKTDESRVSMLGPRGTVGYIAPEVFNRNFGNVSHKSDVYSYGMMILEMIGGRSNINVQVNNTSEIYFPHWIYKHLELDENLELKRIVNEEDGVKVKKMIIVSLWCIQTNPSNRPIMSRVIEMLEGSVDSLEIPPKPFLYSPSRSPLL
ncbi:hypothetical protein CsatA_011688 [Cannabis sativa]